MTSAVAVQRQTGELGRRAWRDGEHGIRDFLLRPPKVTSKNQPFQLSWILVAQARP